MLIALIIVSIAFVLLFIIFLCCVSFHKESLKCQARMMEDMQRDQKERNTLLTRHSVSESLRYAYGISGDIFHHLDIVVGKDLKYIDLIEKLGEYARSMYLYETPLSCLELNVFADKDYQFPQLDKEQSRILWGFLSDIHEEVRPPYAMFELISGLMFSDSFEKAMVLAKNWNILEIKTSQNS